MILYDAGADKNRTDQMIKDVQDLLLTEKGADQYQFFKTEVPVDALSKDADDKLTDPERFIDELEVSAEALKHAPTLLAIRGGWAYWAHGDGSVQNVKDNIKTFDAKARASNPQAQKNAL